MDEAAVKLKMQTLMSPSLLLFFSLEGIKSAVQIKIPQSVSSPAAFLQRSKIQRSAR